MNREELIDGLVDVLVEMTSTAEETTYGEWAERIIAVFEQARTPTEEEMCACARSERLLAVAEEIGLGARPEADFDIATGRPLAGEWVPVTENGSADA